MARRPRFSPHLQSYEGDIRDYNRTGAWSAPAVEARYRQYCDVFQVECPRVPKAREHREGKNLWIYPIMWEVIQGIEENDAACIALGVDFVEEDDLFAFGKILKSNTARSLRRARLTEEQKGRLRERVDTMLATGIIPHEMRVREAAEMIGVGEHWPRLERDVPRDNPYAMRFYKALRTAEGLPATRRSPIRPPDRAFSLLASLLYCTPRPSSL
jgi:hypothetical protein